MSETYRQMKERHQQESNAFPFGFAFNDEQFAEMMKGWGLNPKKKSDLKQIRRIGGGGFVQAKDVPAMREMFKRFDDEMQAAIDADTTGEGFVKDMFECELANHEYCVTLDYSDALGALRLTEEEVAADEKLRTALMKACEAQSKCFYD